MGFDIKQKLAELKTKKKLLPVRIGNIAKNHFLDSFREGGFTDVYFDPWASRKSKNRSDRRNPRPRAILVDSGALRRSIRVGSARWDKIEVGSFGIPYASYHNQGIGKQPVRKFVGSSAVMSFKIRKRIREEIKDVLK